MGGLDIILKSNDPKILIYKSILKTFHGISAVSGVLLMTGSFLYNNIEYNISPGIGDLSIVIGFLIIISKNLFKIIPGKMSEYLTTIGALLMMEGYLYNILVNKFIFEVRDIPALIGFSLIQLATIMYIIKYSFDYVESRQHPKINR